MIVAAPGYGERRKREFVASQRRARAQGCRAGAAALAVAQRAP